MMLSCLDELVIISPFYTPAPGGAARYYEGLTYELINRSVVDRITIFTESHPGKPRQEQQCQGRLNIVRLFPYRAGNPYKKRSDILSYIIQNCLLLTLPFRTPLRKRNSNLRVMVHGYFHNKPSFAPFIILLARFFGRSRIRFTVDLRDPRLPRWALPSLQLYDSIICCSANVFNHVSTYAKLIPKSHVIPIPFEIVNQTDQQVARVLKRFSLEGKRYLYSPNGIQNDKNIVELIRITELLREKGFDLTLVVAGRRRDWRPMYDRASDQGVLKYVGAISHEESLCLTKGAALVPIISPSVEGMPRSALEAIALEVPVILPKNVPEFSHCCSGNIAKWESVEDLVRIAVLVLSDNRVAQYNIKAHEYDQVIPKYRELLCP